MDKQKEQNRLLSEKNSIERGKSIQMHERNRILQEQNNISAQKNRLLK